ncbi:hypothetical protein LWE61_16375 [Sphingobium sufflavum]|nr:hypothetical protein [Sphingobium sufflavum]
MLNRLKRRIMIAGGKPMSLPGTALMLDVALDFVSRHGDHAIADFDEIYSGLVEEGALRTAAEWWRLREYVIIAQRGNATLN